MKSRKQRNDRKKTFRKFGKNGKNKKTKAKRHLMSKKGGDPSQSRQLGGNPSELIDAIQQDNTELSRVLIEGGADINTKNNDGNTPLLLSIIQNNTEISRLLIEKGADIYAKNNNDSTPLLASTIKNNTEISRLLIERGADVNAKNKNGITPLYLAIKKNNSEIIQFLINNGVKPSERFCKHGILLGDEIYHPLLHNLQANSIEERCGHFYTPEQIKEMKKQIEVAECSICLEKITDIENCLRCGDGHKFHKNCIEDYWRISRKNNFCPLTNNKPTTGQWTTCNDLNDIHSGGKKHKKSRKSNRKKKITT